MFQLYLFDLDGTLVNSLDDLGDTCNFLLEEAGLPTHPIDAYRYFVGNGAYKLAERMLPENMRDDETVSRWKAAFDARYHEHYHDKTRPYEGIMELIGTLKKQKVQMAVLSNKPDAFVQIICREMFGEGVFDCVFGQRDGFAKKPAPDGVLEILRILHVKKENAVLIGDSDVDILTAKNAGVFSAGASWGFRGEKELAEAGADCILYRPGDLLRI